MPKLNTIKFNDLKLGTKASRSKIIGEKDVLAMAEITGDYNPLHVDEYFAAHTQFKARIAHGALLTGLVSAVLGMELPGPGAIYVSQSMRFHRPVYFGDSITAEVEIISLLPERNLVKLRTRCTNQENILIADGESMLMVPA